MGVGVGEEGRIMPIRNLSCPVDEENIPEILELVYRAWNPFNYRPGVESLGSSDGLFCSINCKAR